MHRRSFLAASAIGATFGATQCCVSPRITHASEQDPLPAATEQSPKGKLDDTSVFKGESLEDWMTLDHEPVKFGWQAKGGEIFLKRSLLRAGHIVTRKEYGDFEMFFDWKIAKGGNSGLKYRVRKYGDRTLGCEYQIYDPNGQQVDGKNKTASLYDLYAPDETAQPKPPGEWNSAKIVLRDGKIEHWLNGIRVVRATLGDAEWERRIAESKFNDAENFSKNRCGRIMLTDHGSDVFYRNFQFWTFEPNC